ncbi:MAG: hemolysin XhlA family protein, partial [Clostridium sp.]
MNEETKEHILDVHEKRISNHAERLDKLEQNQVEFRIQIENLCKSITGLTSALKWGIGLIGGSFITFFFYAIQTHIFK